LCSQIHKLNHSIGIKKNCQSSLRNLLLYLFKRRGKVKLCCYIPWRCLGGEEVYLLLILDLGTRRGWVVSVMPYFKKRWRTRGISLSSTSYKIMSNIIIY
jgi:hypothetical protein